MRMADMMADLFWLSPGEQGDLSDVVRASLHPPPDHCHQLPIPASSCLQQPEEPEGGFLLGDHEQLGMMMDDGNNRRPSCDHRKVNISPDFSPSATTYPLAEMIHRMSPHRPGVERLQEGDDVAAPERGDRMMLQHMSTVHHHHHPARVPAASKPRKSQTKRVVCIPAPTAASGRQSTSGEVVPSDLWAWRKYGQKPIKGSPYPRGYYRCSSSKGCPARKQVERSRTDPNMLVITYTSDHNHPWPTQRNALAGSTRLSSSAAAAKNTSSSSSLPTAGAQGPPRNSDSGINNNDRATAAAHHQLKQEDDLDLFADMDSLNIFSSITKTHEEDSKQHHQQQLFDPFSSCFFDCL